MKDERIRYRPAERQTLVNHKVTAFCLSSGNLRARQMAELYLTWIEEISAASHDPGPFLYAVSSRGLRQLDLT